MSRQAETIMYARGARRKVLDVDLNGPPPFESNEPTFPHVDVIQGPMPAVQQGRMRTVPVVLVSPGFQPPRSTPPVPINVEDDDVIVSTLTDFEQARNNSRRSQARTSVVNVESAGPSLGLASHRHNPRKRTNPQHLVINLEGSSCSVKHLVAAPPPPPPPPPPTFTCPVCMGPLVEEVTTKCGHIFCRGCIKTAIAQLPKCPTCRRKVNNRDIIRIYLPTTN